MFIIIIVFIKTTTTQNVYNSVLFNNKQNSVYAKHAK